MKTYYDKYFGILKVSEGDGELETSKDINKELEVSITFYKNSENIPNTAINFEKANKIFVYIQQNIELLTKKVIDDLMHYDKEYLEQEGYSREDLEIGIELSSITFKIHDHSGSNLEIYFISTMLTFDDNEIFGNHLINVDLGDDMEIEDVRIEG